MHLLNNCELLYNIPELMMPEFIVFMNLLG